MPAGDARIVRDIVREFGGRRFRLVTRLDTRSPPVDHVSTAHCLAFQRDRVVLAMHHTRGWTIPGGHLEPGESPESAAAREALEEAGAVIAGPILFAHEQIDPEDGIADPPYTAPAFQLFYVARLIALGEVTAMDECTEARLFSADEARSAPGWVQDNRALFDAAVTLAQQAFS